jgi:hypothetical protein
MSTNPSWRVFTGLSGGTLFTVLVLWTTFFGSPTNTLHTNAQGWAFTGLFLLIGTVMGSSLVEKLPSFTPKTA